MITIYHNPKCGTSRNVLAMIRASGVEPVVIDYQKTLPPRDALRQIAADAGLTVRDLLRDKGTPYAELGLGDPALTDDQILDAIEAHPILLQRPLVVTPKETAMCRPSEAVLRLLDTPPASFTKEDGEVVRP